MTTTERARPSPVRSTRASDLKLYLIALLASTYVMAWWLLGDRAPATVAELPVTEPPRAAIRQPSKAVWFTELPPAQRPLVAVPPGWHIVERTASTTSVTTRDVPVPVRRSRARPGRIRTRSS